MSSHEVEFTVALPATATDAQVYAVYTALFEEAPASHIREFVGERDECGAAVNPITLTYSDDLDVEDDGDVAAAIAGREAEVKQLVAEALLVPFSIESVEVQ